MPKPLLFCLLVYEITHKKAQQIPIGNQKEGKHLQWIRQLLKEKVKETTSPIQEVLTRPLTQFTQNILGSSVITVKPKMISTQTKTTSNQEPIQPDFYLPNEKGSRLSEVHQIKTGEKSPKGKPCHIVGIRKLKSKYGTKFFLLD